MKKGCRKMNTTRILAKRMIDSLHNNLVLENTGIADEDLEVLENIVDLYLEYNNQTDWGFDDKLDEDGRLINKVLKEFFIEVTKDFAIMNYNIIEIFGLDDNGYEHLIESIERLKDFDRYVIEK